MLEVVWNHLNTKTNEISFFTSGAEQVCSTTALLILYRETKRAVGHFTVASHSLEELQIDPCSF
jgi:hypothetical protein